MTRHAFLGGWWFFRGRLAARLHEMGLPREWQFIISGELNGYTIRITNGDWASQAFTVTDYFLEACDEERDLGERATHDIAAKMMASIPASLLPPAPAPPASPDAQE